MRDDYDTNTWRAWNRIDWKRWCEATNRCRIGCPEPFIRGHELPPYIVTFDGLTLPYGKLGL